MTSKAVLYSVVLPLHGYNRRGKVSLVLHAYFDESGKFRDPKSRYICLAGYVADDARWTTFCDEWAGLLHKHHIPYVHMKNMIALQGEYEDLGWTHIHRDEVLKEFIGVIRRNVTASFGIGLDLTHYRAMPKESQKRLGGDPFLFCFARLIKRVLETLKQQNVPDPIVMAFDDDKDYAMRCYKVWCEMKNHFPELRERFPAICYADDRIFAPLQGADILAHETNKFMRNCEDGRNPRQMFAELLKSPDPNRAITYITEVWDSEQLVRFAAQCQGREWMLFDPLPSPLTSVSEGPSATSCDQ